MTRLRTAAAVCCSALLASGHATTPPTARRGRLGGLGLERGRNTAWADRRLQDEAAQAPAPRRAGATLLGLRGGGGDVQPELGPYSWIAADSGDGGTLVRLSSTGEVVAGQSPSSGSDGAGKVAAASVTAAVAALVAKVRSGRGESKPAAAKRRAAAAAAAKDAAAKDAAAMKDAKAAAVAEAPAAAAAGVGAKAKTNAEKKRAAVRAGKEKKAAAARALKEKKAAAAARALEKKKEAAARAAVCAVDGGSRDKQGVRAAAGVSKMWPMFSAFLYFLAMAFTIPVLPKVVNELVTGSRAVTAASATLYGLLSSTDAIFTLLTVKFHATLSDKYGRRPFLALSALGLGTGFYMTYHSRRVWMLLAAAAIDGCTSCMYSMAQACITDCVGTGAGLGEAFGVFQGLSLGMAFMLGLPTGGLLGAKYGVRFPLLVSVGLCAVNFLMIAFVMPETLPKEKRAKQVDLKQANPLGAVFMATRNKLITGVISCWVLMWIAHVGLQINWINYTDRKFGWGVAQSGASLALMGLLVAVFPKLIIPRLGLERSITYGLLTYTVGQVVIASAPGVATKHGQYGTPLVVSGLVLTSAGTIVFPSVLAYLCNQVGSGEVGALQGTTDTAKTICSVLCGPAMAWIFGYFISEKAYPRQIEGASYYVGSAVALVAWLTARRTFSVYGALDRFPPSARAKR